jgi:hypothetical protein
MSKSDAIPIVGKQVYLCDWDLIKAEVVFAALSSPNSDETYKKTVNLLSVPMNFIEDCRIESSVSNSRPLCNSPILS